MFELTFAFVILSTILILTNVVASRSNASRYFDQTILVVHIAIALLGLIIAFIPAKQLNNAGETLITNPLAFGGTISLVGIWSLIVSRKAVRVWMAQRVPLDPASPVHTLALVLSGYLIGNTLLTLTQGGLAEMAESATAASILDVLANQLLFTAIAVFGVGFAVRRDGRALLQRLGIERLTWAQVRLGIRWIAGLVMLQWAAGVIAALLDPTQYELLDGLNGALLQDMDTIWEWLILALATGVGEELLFRGAIQPIFGLSATAVLFAIAHVQYGFTVITITIFIIGVVLGYLRDRHSTTLAIFVHAGYNFTLGLLALLAMNFVN